MCDEAEEIGFFTAPSGRLIPKMQIRTIKELLEEGKPFDYPQGYTLKSGSGRKLVRDSEARKLDFDDGGGVHNGVVESKAAEQGDA